MKRARSNQGKTSALANILMKRICEMNSTQLKNWLIIIKKVIWIHTSLTMNTNHNCMMKSTKKSKKMRRFYGFLIQPTVVKFRNLIKNSIQNKNRML